MSVRIQDVYDGTLDVDGESHDDGEQAHDDVLPELVHGDDDAELVHGNVLKEQDGAQQASACDDQHRSEGHDGCCRPCR